VKKGFIAAILMILVSRSQAWAAPSAPFDLEVECATATAVELGWSIRTNSTGVALERAEGLENFRVVGTMPACICGGLYQFDYYDMLVQPGKQYFYRARAFDTLPGGKGASYSPYSNIVVINTPAMTFGAACQ
jgi:hypothetical protein